MIYGIPDFAAKITEQRKKLGISQAALANQVGAQQSYVARFESGKHDIRLSRLLELIRILGMDIIIVPKERIPKIEALLKIDIEKKETPLLYAIDTDEDDDNDAYE